MLLERNPKGKVHMERFFRTLCQHLKKATGSRGWFSISSRNMADIVYITVPVGFQYYKKVMKEIVEKSLRGVNVEFIEEPLAAAVGYQVIEKRDKVILIIDFGGSTLNSMIVRINIGGAHVVAKPERAQMLGGHDIDHWLAEDLAKKAGLPLEKGTSYRLLALAEGIKIDLSSPGAVKAYEEGKKFWWQRRGQLHFACANCHMDLAGKNFGGNQPLSAALGHTTAWPAQRLEWGRLETIHQRYKTCNSQVRAKPFKHGSEVYNNLQFYETYMSSGLPLTAPAMRN